MILPPLVNAFFAQDCDAAVRQKLLTEIGKHGAAKADVVREFTFNRFNVRLDFLNGEVTVEDELDTSEQGSVSIPLSDFAAALHHHQG